MKWIAKKVKGWISRYQYRSTKRWMERKCSEEQQRHIRMLANVIE